MSSLVLLLILCVQPLVWAVSVKKGVCHWADNFMDNDFEVLTNFAWWTDWRCNNDYFYDNGIATNMIGNYEDKYVPMVWGIYSSNNYSCHAGFSSDYILGYNEPNHLAQCDRTGQQAAADWSNIVDNAPGKQFISPSAAPCGSGCNGNTTEWLDSFFDACNGNCQVDYIATHTYWCNADKVMDFLEMLYNRYNKKIWLTEFACRHSKNKPSRVLTFMQDILPRLESASFVYRYAWYMARIPDDSTWVQTSASLFKPNVSELTPLGEYYQNYNP